MNTVKTVNKRGANHALHIIMMIITFGLWTPIWILAAMKGRKEVTRQQVMPYPQQPYWGPPQQLPQHNPYSQH